VLCDAENMKFAPHFLDPPAGEKQDCAGRAALPLFGFGLRAVCQKENGKLIGGCRLTTQNINGTIFPENGKAAARRSRPGILPFAVCAELLLHEEGKYSLHRDCRCEHHTSLRRIYRLQSLPSPGFYNPHVQKWQALGREKQAEPSQHTKERTCINEKLTI